MDVVGSSLSMEVRGIALVNCWNLTSRYMSLLQFGIWKVFFQHHTTYSSSTVTRGVCYPFFWSPMLHKSHKWPWRQTRTQLGHRTPNPHPLPAVSPLITSSTLNRLRARGRSDPARLTAERVGNSWPTPRINFRRRQYKRFSFRQRNPWFHSPGRHLSPASFRICAFCVPARSSFSTRLSVSSLDADYSVIFCL